MKHVGRKEQKINECFQLRRGLVLTQHKATATMHTHTHIQNQKGQWRWDIKYGTHCSIATDPREERIFTL